jgi:hypothetical protein
MEVEMVLVEESGVEKRGSGGTRLIFVATRMRRENEVT